MSAAPRVVLDTNVVLSALVFAGGRLVQVRHAWHAKRFEPLASVATADELARVVAYPRFKLTSAEQRELLADYLPYCTVVATPAKPPKVPQCRDRDDVPFLHLAVTGNADYLVTGDKDLLAVAPRFACPIIAPEEFLRLRLFVSPP
jgi:putative PIN family toxin of toxin-antitoxin system